MPKTIDRNKKSYPTNEQLTNPAKKEFRQSFRTIAYNGNGCTIANKRFSQKQTDLTQNTVFTIVVQTQKPMYGHKKSLLKPA